MFAAAQDAFPGAKVQASTFEKYVDRLAPFVTQTGTHTMSHLVIAPIMTRPTAPSALGVQHALAMVWCV